MKNPPAFPRALSSHEAGDTPQEGMSLRDYFAAHAPSLDFNSFDEVLTYLGKTDGLYADRLVLTARAAAKWRYEYADAMLAEREEVKS